MGDLSNIPESNICGIYAIINNETGTMYIGESSQLNTRANAHLRLIREKKHNNKNLEYDLQKYNDFSFIILQTLNNREDLEILELKTIKHFLVCGFKLYNCDTVESIEKRLRSYERWKLYKKLISNISYNAKKYTYYQFITFSESRQQRTIQKVCEIMNCQPGDIMEYTEE